MIKKHIPNTITLLNLVCGCLAIISTFHKSFELTAILVVLAAVLDFFDGFAARLLKVHSDMGKQLDSLADMVTFGVVPGFVMYELIIFDIGNSSAYIAPNEPVWYLAYFALLIPVFSAYRLAKFNIDTRQNDSFIGLPTPANALFICFLPMLMIPEGNQIAGILLKPYFLIALCFIQAYLMIAELPLIALKFKQFGYNGNEWRYALIMLTLVSLIIIKAKAIPLIIILYVALSILQNITNKSKN
ncbi:MAG TPA: CDP-diacylglycerol--serine O-phosphatidyltransferase [Bacteroidia bacterium]|nr:CDP-diacylglycerol--serine O-phosphatidyltransferase [Bacteroidia bacterium]